MTKLNWRDASKKLPAKNYYVENILVVCNGDIIACCYVSRGFYFSNDDGNGKDFINKEEITHWLPLNELPLPEE